MNAPTRTPIPRHQLPARTARPGRHWLIRVRWCVAAAQLLTCAAVWAFLRVELPVAVLAVGFLITIGTNALLSANHRPATAATEQKWCGAVLVLDTLVLTGMLYWTGGQHNPLTVFYLLNVTLAAVLLPAGWVWLQVALCALCYLGLFYSSHQPEHHHDSENLHLLGMWVALVFVASFIAYFVKNLSRDLAASEAELADFRVQAARAERAASLATLAAGVAHELATPLGTIAVASAELQRHAQSSPDIQVRDDAHLIRQEVDRCRRILEKLSLTTQGDGDPRQPLRLGDLSSGLQSFLTPDQFRRLDIYCEASDASIMAPRLALLQALAALIKNACDASEPEARTRLLVQLDDDTVGFEICDQGLGMSPEQLSRAGEPFYTTKPPGHGVGLGLFLVNTFVDRMQGRLTLQSQVGQGTTATLQVPT